MSVALQKPKLPVLGRTYKCICEQHRVACTGNYRSLACTALRHMHCLDVGWWESPFSQTITGLVRGMEKRLLQCHTPCLGWDRFCRSEVCMSEHAFMWCSVGAHVRDAAAYVCWAFARAYTAADLADSITVLMPALLVTSCYDREV